MTQGSVAFYRPLPIDGDSDSKVAPEQKKPQKPKKPVPFEEEDPHPKSKVNRNEAPALPELAQEAEQASQPALRDLFRELAVPFDMVTWKDQAKRQKRVAPVSDYIGAKPARPISAVNLRFHDEKGHIGAMIQVQISDIERIDHYEEIAIDRVQKLLDGSGRDSDKAPAPSERMAAAEKVLAAVSRFHDSARDSGQRDAGWGPLAIACEKSCSTYSSMRLRMMVDGGEWAKALDYASRLARSYPEPDVQIQLAQSLGRLVEQSLKSKNYEEARVRLGVLEAAVPQQVGHRPGQRCAPLSRGESCSTRPGRRRRITTRRRPWSWF